ncbi:MAG: hypothetical protein GY804_08830 [Alphaproteobacteria bacterium]|nr:hypothetical protein [Alphaproteobacteria bacterium]
MSKDNVSYKSAILDLTVGITTVYEGPWSMFQLQTPNDDSNDDDIRIWFGELPESLNLSVVGATVPINQWFNPQSSGFCKIHFLSAIEAKVHIVRG